MDYLNIFFKLKVKIKLKKAKNMKNIFFVFKKRQKTIFRSH